MSTLAECVVRDLREYAADLLDPGLAPAVRHRSASVPGSLASFFEVVSALLALVPRLAAELEVDDFSHREEEHLSAVPKRARLPRRAVDYVHIGGRLLPCRWTTLVPIEEADVRPLGWLLHLLGLARAEAERADRRLSKRIEEALRSRRGTSVFARAEAETLRMLQKTIGDARGGVDRAERFVVDRSGGRQSPTPKLPRPFPRGPSWSMLRRIAEPLTNPLSSLPVLVQNLLRHQTVTADMPFLYQRWCGVKLVQGLVALGFAARDDAASALFLGGRVRFVRDGVPVTVWCEPRLAPKIEHECGLSAMRGEATPDYVIVFPGPGGEDAFILDPTLDHDQEACASKARYLSGIASRKPRFIAGIPTRRHPLRSWAAAPLGESHCRIDSSDGSKGTIPMNPVAYDPGPLRGWLTDLALHADAWRPAVAPSLDDVDRAAAGGSGS